MKVGIVGCGIAGTTCAILLAKAGHDVTLIEQAHKVGPVGAGFLLQPSGQQVLERLGLLQAATQHAARIDGLLAEHSSGRPLVRLEYERFDSSLFALGVHRGEIFSALVEACRQSGVTLTEGVRVVDFEQSESSIALRTADGEFDRFDIVIASDGSQSTLRASSGLACRVHEYDYAALWKVGRFTGETNLLRQVVQDTTRLVGILPIGQQRCSFFWGLRQDEFEPLRAGGVEAWKRTVTQLVPMAEEIVSEIQSFDELTFSTYRDVRMKQVSAGRLVFVGDAAHSSSPHLGQGVNLALGDAESLANAIVEESPHGAAFARYAHERRSITRFYSELTALLTPFFQSDQRLLGWGRDLALPIMPKLPYVGGQMVKGMAGLKRSWLR